MTTTVEYEPELEAIPPADGSGLRRALLVVVAISALVIVAAGGYLVGHRSTSTGTAGPAVTSVDAGFAWDMQTHHLQAVEMAGYARDHTTDPAVKLLAYDIETSQYNQAGEMRGWLEAWGLPVSNPNPQMAWMAGSGHDQMASGGLMPGMATEAELTKFETMTGKAMDVYFLQLMLRHHQGGLPMAQWAASHAKLSYVRNSAQKMFDSQSSEVIALESMLRERGASPLPTPA